MKVRIGGFNELSVIDSEGIACVIFFQGCSRRCKNCHNPSLWDFNGGTEVDTNEIIEKIKKHLDWYDAVVFQGGEPLEQKEALKELLIKTKELGLERWLYTGYSEEEIPPDIFNLCSVIVAGEYIDELKTNGFPASSNQKVIDLRR